MNREQIAAAVRGILYSATDSGGLILPSSVNGIACRVADALTESAPTRVADALTTPASTWTLVHDVAYERVRRMRVPLGWMYQTEIDQFHAPGSHVQPGARVIGWHPPIFVPDLHDDGGAQ